MTSPSPQQTPGSGSAHSGGFWNTDRLLVVLTYVAAALFFMPLSAWMLRQMMTQEQLLQAMSILLLAGFTLVYSGQSRVRWVFQFSDAAMSSLVGGFVLTALGSLIHQPLLLLGGYCLAMVSGITYVFGRRALRVAVAFSLAFGLWVVLAMNASALDWPLRHLAGRWAAWGLAQFGFAADLSLASQGGQWILLMRVDGQPFEVAAECNGFGLLASTFLLAVLLSIYRRFTWLDRVAYVGSALILGFAGNIVRIMIICVLAPRVGSGNYFLMHEIVGTAVYLAVLGLVWWLLATHPLKGRGCRVAGRIHAPRSGAVRA